MAPSSDSTITNLTVHGSLPAGLSGQLVGVAPDGLVHSVYLHAGRALSYRSRRVIADGVVSSVISFGGSILATVAGALAYELSWELEPLRQVDLAGQSRVLTAYPKLDAQTGELHILTVDAVGAQMYVVVSAGGLTRVSRSLTDAPTALTDLVVTSERIVFVGDGFVGIASRRDSSLITWIVGDVVPHTMHVEDFVPAGDWLVGFANHTANTTDLAIVGAAAVRIPRAIPRGLHSTWIPATHQPTTTNQGETK